jgi:glycosyltransferase involved in cell wall biosynthesis
MKVAIVHDYLNQAGGAERVVDVLHSMYPSAPIYTTILDRQSLWPGLRDADIRTSWAQWLPGVDRHFKAYFPLYPSAVESFDLREYDLVISSSSAYAKGAITRADACHICYCHNPMRFAWDYERYVGREELGRATRMVLPALIRRVRAWDLRTARRPDLYVANSTVVAERIRRHYGRDCEIVFPPVGTGRYAPGRSEEEFFLIVSRLASYKRIDLAVKAFTRLGKLLIVIGDGPDRPALERIAGPTVQFRGRLPDDEVADHYARCRGFVLPGEEDFGITPLEANASGKPVVAFGAGGALDTVREGVSGVLFHEQTVEALGNAIQRCEQMRWDEETLCKHAAAFSEEVFRRRFAEVVDRVLDARRMPGRISDAA